VTDVHLHIGLHKTGTTSVQAALTHRAAALAEAGVLVPGGGHREHVLAAYDLLGRRIDGDETAPVEGAWRRLVAAIDGWNGPQAVVSEELLSFARPRQVKALAGALASHRLHVVVGVRDLGRILPSAWQQEITQGRTYSWQDYVTAVRDPADPAGPPSAGVAFWLRFDVLRILQTWARVVPTERITVLVVPPPGALPATLLERFAAAATLPQGLLTLDDEPRRPSLGAAEVEALRRLNAAVAGDVSQKQYAELLRRGVRPGLTRPGSRPLTTPAEELGWLSARTATFVDGIRDAGYPVVGDLAELAPVVAPAGTPAPDDVDESALLHATEDALASLSREFAVLWKRHRRTKPVDEPDVEPGERLRSRSRSMVFEAKVAALEAADRHRSLAWLARRSVR
jgi:hypothetical protein